MTLKGNYHLMFASELVAGAITYPLCLKFGVMGLLFGIIPFAIGMFVVLSKYDPDEREMALTYKISSYESICAGVIAGVIYFCFPQLNWFFALVSGIGMVRGIIGLIVFTVR
jgi:hypothetical protein